MAKRLNRIINSQTRHKMSEAKRGSRNPNYGKHLTEQQRRKISLAMRRYWATIPTLD